MSKITSLTVNSDGMDPAAAEALFDQIELFAGYAFNRSHAVEYTLIAYQAAYLKAHYLVEFYSAQMGTTKDDKLTILAKQAASDGIRVIPPDINVSTHQFEPLNDVIIAAPLNVVMGVSEKGVAAIMEARRPGLPPTVIETTSGRGKDKVTTSQSYGPGRFVSIEDFSVRVAARAVNTRATDNLNRVGAFARVEPGQLPSLHASRQKDQIELMPAIADQGVSADRAIDFDGLTADAITTIEEDMRKNLPGSPQPCFLGCEPKMLFILDAPFNDYDALANQFSFQQFVAPSLHKAGLTIEDAAWSWVLRRPLNKGETSPPVEEIAASLPYLQREIAVMKPPVIVLLGGIAIKQFFPDMKKPGENIGHKAFSAALDATVIVGFKPTRIYHDAGMADRLTEIFSEAAKLVEDST